MNDLEISDYNIEADNFKDSKKINTRKLLIISFFMSVIGLVIIMRVLDLSVLYSDKKTIHEKETLSNTKYDRGLLLDRNNKILASNIFIYNLKAYPRKIKNVENTIRQLKQEIEIAEEESREKINNKNKFEVVLVKNITAPVAKKINNLGIPGIEFIPVIKRFYPQGNLASHYLGHVNETLGGVSGAERTFNDLLIKGEDVKLGIDIRVQYVVRDELYNAYKKFRAKSATAIIADINTGEIISKVSIPDYNPNQSIDPKKDSYRNTATLNLYEMGSTFKIFSIAAALEGSEINIDTKFDARKPIKIAKHIIKDYHPQNKILTTKEIFLKSSNIGSSLIALKLGNSNLKNFYDELGLLSISKINIQEKAKPMIPDKWGEVETATLSFGHGLSISPIQMVEAAAMLFNENKLFSATIKKRPLDYNYQKINLISNETKEIIKNLMFENTITGTATKAKINGYEIGGKTATGEKVNIYGKYDKTKLVSSFLSVFPIKKPKYISLILFDEPKLEKKYKGNSIGATGGVTAAPTTARILKRVMPLLGIVKQLNNKEDIIVKNKDKLNFASY